ncbi:hypothetical protein Acr_05g0012780 [Actinidia rufa]|uniref:Uncharacterized protein n=1 Tax=Actinidia rufa TaxID=165716 RepID=A0A7J0ENT1_9ERIC|nr:hypothetical protein Acr_05g0012780 [Actinidia rufa]
MWMYNAKAPTKAAALGWHQHGSGSDGIKPPVSEFGAPRAHHPPQATQCKMETLRATHTPSDRNSGLLDAYEMERISRQLDDYMEGSESSEDVKREKKSKGGKGFWLVRHGMVGCGGLRDDVVEPTRGFRVKQPLKKRGEANR